MGIRSSIKEKSATLHQEFPVEVSFFIDFIRATIHAVKINFQELQTNWKREGTIYEFTVWIQFMNNIDSRIKSSKKELNIDSETFAQLLFGDSNMMFTLHCLYHFVHAIPENVKFNNRVKDLLF